MLQTALNDFSASYQLCAYTKNPEKQAAIYSELHQNILDIFRDAGIEMIIPHYQSIRDGNKSTVPAKDSSEGTVGVSQTPAGEKQVNPADIQATPPDTVSGTAYAKNTTTIIDPD